MIYDLLEAHAIVLTFYLPLRVATIFANFYFPGLSRSKTLS